MDELTGLREHVQLLGQMGGNQPIQAPFSPHFGIFNNFLCCFKSTYFKRKCVIAEEKRHFSECCGGDGDSST